MNTLKRAMIVLLILMTFTVLSKNAYAGIKERRVTNKTEWLIITDSYGVTPIDEYKKTWPYQFVKKMHLDNSQYCFLRLDSHGYARTGKQYITHVKKLRGSRNLKRIIVSGGINNDRFETLEMIYTSMAALDTKLRKKYPNAKIYMAAPNWDTRPERHSFLTERKKIYREYGETLDWKWLSRPSNVLKKNTGWCISDYHHPNAKGGNLIAEAMYYAFRGYKKTCKVYFLPNGGTGKKFFKTQHYGKEYVFPSCTYVRTGCRFIGWKSRDGKIHKAGEKVRNLSTDDSVVYKAVWRKNI